MAVGTLTSAFIKRVGEGRGDPGKFHDGGGLILRVRPGGTSGWIFRWQREGQRREMGMGTLPTVTLATARELADSARRVVATGGDPLDERKTARVARAHAMTFDAAAAQYVAQHEPGWKNAKHRQQWHNTLATYVSPKIGAAALKSITTADVVSILTPIWNTKPETGSRVRSRIEMILDWAKSQGIRDGENPARWRGHIANIFPAKTKVRAVKHHAAVAVVDMPKVFKRLSKAEGAGAAAVRFCILTAARPGEVANATLAEIDRANATWTLPPARQKSGKPHRVPLSAEALSILDAMDAIRANGDTRLFPGKKQHSPLSLTALAKALERAAGSGVTVHGTARSTFDDWGTENTAYAHTLIDRALAHGPKSKTVAAYRRSELFEARRPLMRDWGKFLRG